MGYSMLPFYYFDAQIISDLGSKNLLMWVSVSFWHVSVIVSALPYFLAQQDVPDLCPWKNFQTYRKILWVYLTF